MAQMRLKSIIFYQTEFSHRGLETSAFHDDGNVADEEFEGDC